MLTVEKNKGHGPPSLAEAMDFTLAELDLNRDGQLSGRQHDRLLTDANLLRILELLVYAIAAVVGGGVILDGILRQDTLSSRIALLGVVGAVAFGIAFAVRRMTARYWLDIDEPVAAVQGNIILDFAGSGDGQMKKLTISVSGETFDVTKATFLAFKSGDPYVLYYAPNTRRLLSAEALRLNE